MLIQPLSVANKPQPRFTWLDWGHTLYTEKKDFSLNELFNLVYSLKKYFVFYKTPQFSQFYVFKIQYNITYYHKHCII